MSEVNQITRAQMLVNRIRQLKKESLDLEFIKYLNDMELCVLKGEFPIEYYENQVERNYRIYLQKNTLNQNTKKDYPGKDTFEFNVGAFVLGVVGVLFILVGLTIFAANYIPDSAKDIFLYIVVMVVSVSLLVVSKIKNLIFFKFIGLLGAYLFLYPIDGAESNSVFITRCILLFAIHMVAILIPMKKQNNGFRITGLVCNTINMLLLVGIANAGNVDEIFVLIHIVLAAIVFYTQALKTPLRKENSTTVFLIIGSFFYYVAFSSCIKSLLWEHSLYYIAIILGIYLIVQVINRFKPIPGVAATFLIATFISYISVLRQDAFYSLFYLAAFGVSIVLIRNWKLLYEFVITAAFVIYPMVNSGTWTTQWQSELNILIVSGILVTLFLVFNHIKWLESPKIKVYNIISIFILGILQLATMACDNIFVCIFMLIVGLLVFYVLFQERYYTAISKKDIWVIAYLTYVGIIFPVESFAVTNIIMTVIALCSVIIGFCKREKTIRIYGLLLALFICAKIVIYDYRTVSQMQRMLLFLGVGVVILIISFVYMWLEKRLKKQQ